MELCEYYEEIKSTLEAMGHGVEDYRDINCGIQFNVLYDGKKALIRIYSGKKGLKIDLSQIKDPEAANELSQILNRPGAVVGNKSKNTVSEAFDDPEELIGTDESGKGDYFGPLVIAGVYGDKQMARKLADLGVMDSKKLSDKQIGRLSSEIKNLCPYSVVVIGNERYNELYNSIKNLNRLLAWGHARVIENMLGKVECKNALSDQFGDPKLIENALMEKGKNIILRQRPKAEENVIVAAASVLARCEFVERMEQMGQRYGMEFPKGASGGTIDAARDFGVRFGKEELNKVAKLHFKTTLSV